MYWSLLFATTSILTVGVAVFLFVISRQEKSHEKASRKSEKKHQGNQTWQQQKKEYGNKWCGSRTWFLDERCISKESYHVNYGTEHTMQNWEQMEREIDWNKEKEMDCGQTPILWIRMGSNMTVGSSNDAQFVPQILDRCVHSRIIVVFTDGDRPIPSSLCPKLVHSILSHSKLVHLYAQNFDSETNHHEKLRPIPIGFDLHSRNNLSIQQAWNLLNSVHCEPKKKKVQKVFCDSHLSVTHPSRLTMHDDLKNIQAKNSDIVEFLTTRCSYSEILHLYAQYQFVACPRGNGHSSHRLYETLWVGSYPVTLHGPLDPLFQNLPVVHLNSWSEITPHLLSSYHLHFSKRFPSLSSVRQTILQQFHL